MPELQVELLTSPGCPHAEDARALVLAALDDFDGAVDIATIEIGDESAAASYDYRGSPTIRIAGRDVEPDGRGPVGVACRVYQQPDGSVRGVPSRATIERAVAAWQDDQRIAPDGGSGGGATELPGRVLRAGLLWASRRRSLERLATGNPLTRRVVRRFVAGSTLGDVTGVLESLREHGFATTVDVLGESVETPEAAVAAADEYLALLRTLETRALDRNVSLKLTAMGLDVDPDLCRSNVGRIVGEARRIGAFVRIDMEDHTRADATLAIVHELHARYREVGAVIQSYLRRSANDIAALNDADIRVRLCKGAYDEPASVAYPSKADVDENYRRLTEQLLLHGRYPGLATHDEAMIDHALAFADREGIGPDRFEFQMLYGIRRDLQERLRADGWTVRVYVPYGREWYPYFMRRLAERPANLLFILRNLARGG